MFYSIEQQRFCDSNKQTGKTIETNTNREIKCLINR